MKKILSILILLLVNISPVFSYTVENTIQGVYADGKLIKMLDGSVYKIFDYDAVTSSIWLPYTDVIITDNEIINTDDDERVEYIKRIK
jgi:hypothetical protein